MVDIRAFAKAHQGTLLLLAGGLTLFMSLLRPSVGELGWVAFAPFLVALHRDGSLKRHLGLLSVLLVTFVLTISKIVTEEIPWGIALMFGVPIAVANFAMLSVAGAAHRRLGARWGIYSFPAMAAAAGWIRYTFTPAGSWGALAHTQVDNLRLVQMAALTGIGGITFLGDRSFRRPSATQLVLAESSPIDFRASASSSKGIMGSGRSTPSDTEPIPPHRKRPS